MEIPLSVSSRRFVKPKHLVQSFWCRFTHVRLVCSCVDQFDVYVEAGKLVIHDVNVGCPCVIFVLGLD